METKEKKERKKDKKDKKDKKKSKHDETSQPAEEPAEEAPPLFMIDTKPTPVNHDTTMRDAEPGTTTAAADAKPSSYNAPPSGMNRQARRRLKLIERQREVIQKKLGEAAGADEVQTALDEWVATYDAKAAAREEKQRVRKEKEAARLKKKNGKILTGRALKERKKQIATVDKKAARREKQKGGISKQA